MIAWNQANPHSPSPASSASPLPLNANPGGPAYQRRENIALGLHIFRNLAENKINMAAVNTSKSGLIICVNI